MLRIFAFAATTLVAISVSSGAALAQDAAKAEVVAPPKGQEQFFKGLAALAKKYPDAAARFSIVETKRITRPPNASTKSAHHACCEWTTGTRPQCNWWCPE